VFSYNAFAQLPVPAMVGYWENWNGSNFIDLKDIDSRYNVIQVSFAESKGGKNYELEFAPANTYSDQQFKQEIADLQSQGKKVLISLGGQNGVILIKTAQEKDIFVSSLNAIIDEWGFDGVDIDLEGNSLGFSDVNIQNPGDVKLQLLIQGIKEAMEIHHTTHQEKMLLTMAPETFYVQGGIANPTLGDHKGAYLPIIEELSDSIDMLNVQLYNSGSMYGLDGQVYAQGTADWILAMTEIVIQGFSGNSVIGDYSGFPASKVGVALPGCHSYDAVPHKDIEKAIHHLMGNGPKPGSYTLVEPNGYPDLMGMMTWSINSDRKCSPSYGFVDTYSKIFTDSAYIEIENVDDIRLGAEDSSFFAVKLFNDYFTSTLDSSNWTITNLPDGVVLDTIVRVNDSTAHVFLANNSSGTSTTCYWNVTVTIDPLEFNNATLSLVRGNGVILKTQPSKIPGVVEAESTFNHYSGGIGGDWEDANGKRVRFNSNHWIELEIDVDAKGDYQCDFRFATSSGTHKVILKVDGAINSVQTINTTTDYLTWETHSFNTALDSGHHVLTVHLSSGWMNVNWLEFTNVTGIESIYGNRNNQQIIYPNPATNTIYFTEDVSNTISVYSLNGALIQEFSIANNQRDLDISELNAGIYLLKIQNQEGKIFYNKLVKK
jgi:chitinase